MKKIILTLSIFTLLLSCSCNSKNCFNNLEGKYVNTRNSKSINYLLINKNGTYLHYYKNDDLEFSSKGNWKKSDDVNCAIELNDWENYNEAGSNYEKFGSYFFKINNDELNNGFDGYIDSSFKKVD